LELASCFSQPGWQLVVEALKIKKPRRAVQPARLVLLKEEVAETADPPRSR
jgi:hypothetical protein